MADLDDILEDEGTTGDPTFDEIGKEAAAQLYARFQKGEKLPGTDLLKIVTAYFKAKEEALKNQASEDKVFTLTELLVDVNLPPERKEELLRSEHAFLSHQLSQIEQALVGDANALQAK